MKMKIIFWFLFFSFYSIGMTAQNFTLSGFVKDANNGEDLIGATVQVEKLIIGTTTNAYGFYSFELPAGEHEIAISYLGFETQIITLDISKDTPLNIDLGGAAEQLQEVIVSATAADENITSTQMGVEKISVATIKQVPVVLGEPDVVKSLLLLPGVSNVSESSTSFNVRGGSGDQNLILLDEANIYNASHLLGFLSVFNSDAIKDVKLYKGGIPAKYGGRLSSVLEVRQREGNNKQFSGSAGIGLIASRLNLEGPLGKGKNDEGKGSWIIAGRRSYVDVFLNLLDDFKNDVLFFHDLNAKVNYNFGEKDRVFLSGYFGRDRLNLGSILGNDWGNRSFTFRWNHLYSNRLFGNLSLTSSKYDYALRNFRPGTEFEWTADISNLTGRKDFNFFLNNKNELNFGVEGNYSVYRPGEIKAIEDSPIQTTIYDKNYSLEIAGYLSNDYKPTKWLGINYGLRYSRFYRLGQGTIAKYKNDEAIVKTETGGYVAGEKIGETTYKKGEVIKSFGGLAPRISARVTLDSKSSIKAGYHRMYQYLHLISNTTSASPLDIWSPSGPFKAPQRADQISVGYFRNFSNNKYEFSVEGYYKSLDNLVDFVDGAQLLFNENLETELLTGTGRAYGLEFQLRKKKGRFNGWLSYTLARAEKKIEGINNGNYYAANFDKTHDLSLTGMYKYNKRVSFSANFVYATGQPTTYPSGRYEYSGLVLANYSQRNKDRLPDYHRLDISMTLKSKAKRKLESQWIFSLYNVYNRKNSSSVSFREKSSDVQGKETATGLSEAVSLSFFGIVPGVTYEIKF